VRGKEVAGCVGASIPFNIHDKGEYFMIINK